MFVVTQEWMESNRTARGGFTKKQAIAMGERWPLVAGWLKRAIGKTISEDARLAFEAGKLRGLKAESEKIPGLKGSEKRWDKAAKKLARDLLKTDGQHHEGCVSIFAYAAPIAERALGVRSSGGAKTFLINNFDELTRYCRETLAAKRAPQLRALPTAARRSIDQGAKRRVEHVISKCSIDPASDAFLESFEWRAARMLAIKRYGPVCQCCGASPKTGAVINVDHIKPRRLFPELALDQDNLQILCHDCNHGKGSWDQTDWRTAA